MVIELRLLISRHLENFLALYEARNMHVAAEKKGISQPALTKSLKLLESEVGAELFVRTSRGLEPTDLGEILYEHARAIDQESRFATLNIGELHRTLGGQLRVGVGQVLAVSVFPEVLVAFHQQFPSVRVIAEAGISTKLVEGLLRGDFDLVIAALPQDALPERFVATPLFKSEMVVVCRREHPLRSRGRITLDDLLEFERVGFVEDQEFEKKSELKFGARARRMRPAIESTSLSIMFGILKATDYYAVVSEMILRRAQREGLDQLVVSENFWQLEIDLICKVSLISSRPVRMMKNALLSSWND